MNLLMRQIKEPISIKVKILILALWIKTYGWSHVLLNSCFTKWIVKTKNLVSSNCKSLLLLEKIWIISSFNTEFWLSFVSTTKLIIKGEVLRLCLSTLNLGVSLVIVLKIEEKWSKYWLSIKE